MILIEEQLAITILTSVVTGGFVLVLVELGNRKNRENDKYEQLMNPFMHKLSAYFRLISWCQGYLKYPKHLSHKEEKFQKLISEIGKYGGKLILQGCDYELDSFTANRLNDIALEINNIWYWYDQMRPCGILWDDKLNAVDEYINKEIKELKLNDISFQQNVYSVADVSGKFYTEIYQPIQYRTYQYERYRQIYNCQTWVIWMFVCFTLVVLDSCLWFKLPIIWLQISTSLVILLLICSLLMLAIDMKSQLKWWFRVQHCAYKYRLQLLGLYEKVKSNRILKILLLIGLLLSLWAIFSIEIAIIPMISTMLPIALTEKLNGVFLFVAYFYLAIAILYVMAWIICNICRKIFHI